MIPSLYVASSLFAASTQAQTPSGVDPTAQDAGSQEGGFGQVSRQMDTVIQDIKAAEVEAVARIHMAMRNVVESLMKMEHSMHTRVEDPPNIVSASISETPD